MDISKTTRTHTHSRCSYSTVISVNLSKYLPYQLQHHISLELLNGKVVSWQVNLVESVGEEDTKPVKTGLRAPT